MKLTTGFLLLLACGALAQVAPPTALPQVIVPITRSLDLEWDKNAEPDIVGYEVVYGEDEKLAPPTVKAPRVTVTTTRIANLAPGKTYYFAVRAINAAGLESGLSSIISSTAPALPIDPVPALPIAPVPPKPPSNLRTMVAIETSSNLDQWETLALVPLNNGDPSRYIRTRLVDVAYPPSPPSR